MGKCYNDIQPKMFMTRIFVKSICHEYCLGCIEDPLTFSFYFKQRIVCYSIPFCNHAQLFISAPYLIGQDPLPPIKSLYIYQLLQNFNINYMLNLLTIIV